ncbi:MAG: hypothetical protein GY913_30650 [Proteobacteria bacterium]|nr:hypothetical protein [Pseudomonadota bacterium]
MTPTTLILLLACNRGDGDTAEPPVVHPTLMVRHEMKDDILAKLDSERHQVLLQQVRDRAAEDYRETSLEGWDSGTHGHNGKVAQANAFLAWLLDDEVAAAKALEGFTFLDDDWHDNDNWDINIRMAYPMMGYTNAHDLLLGTAWYPAADQERSEQLLTSLNEQFYDTYVADDTMRQITLGFSQNNHPIRTASTIGYVALAFRGHPDAQEWLDFAIEENAYLWGPEGHYLQPDGGISEGPLYYHFGLSAAIPFFIAVENSTQPDDLYTKSCINRQDVDPWLDHGCVPDEQFTFDNPLDDPRFGDAYGWSVSIRLPWGPRPPLADARFDSGNGGPILEHWLEGTYGSFDWATNIDDPEKTSGGMELGPWYVAYADAEPDVSEPPFTTRFMPQAGNAVFRSDWSSDAIWLLLVAENGDARKTLHDHADGTSFTLAAYGDYLLLDPGYYKPNELDNAVTAQGDAHNLLLIDGQGPPKKGLLQDFGDTDTFLENTYDSRQLAYAEAHTAYEGTDIERSVVFVRERWFVVADRLSGGDGDRAHTFRTSGWAGTEETGGSFELTEDGARWEKTSGGVTVHVASTDGDVSMGEPERTDWDRPHVHEYDSSAPGHHRVIDATVSGVAPGFLSVLAPYRVGGTGDEAELAVSSIDAGEDAAAWLVGSDVVWLRGSSASSSLTVGEHTLATDGELVVVGLEDGLALVARGSAVTLDGAALQVVEPD